MKIFIQDDNYIIQLFQILSIPGDRILYKSCFRFSADKTSEAVFYTRYSIRKETDAENNSCSAIEGRTAQAFRMITIRIHPEQICSRLQSGRNIHTDNTLLAEGECYA